MNGLPEWAYALISIGSSTAFTTIVSLIIKHYFEKALKKKEEKEIEQKAKDDELYRLQENERRQERKADVLASVQEVITPLTEQIVSLNTKLDKVADGTLSTLRNDILNGYYKCVDKGYRNDYDYQNIHHMFDSYKELNGNSYVADVVERFDNLPTKEEKDKQGKQNKKKASTTKKVLVENK